MVRVSLPVSRVPSLTAEGLKSSTGPVGERVHARTSRSAIMRTTNRSVTSAETFLSLQSNLVGETLALASSASERTYVYVSHASV